jgi:hypothetical protein
VNAVDLLRDRAAAIESSARSARAEAAHLDWTQPLLPGASPLGLTFWHLPRTIDWLMNTCVRDSAEVADGASYGSLPDPDRYGFGTGLSAEAAQTAAASIDRDDLERYATEVHREFDAWLATLTETDLDRVVVEFRDRQARRPSYGTAEALAEVGGLMSVPLGVLLVRPGVAHQMMHLGEIGVIRQLASASS